MIRNIPILITAALLLTFSYYKYTQKEMQTQVQNELEQIVLKINQDNNSTWKAQNYPRFTYSSQQLKSMFNLIVEDELPDSFDQPPLYETEMEDLPQNFDAREQWPECSSIKEVWDQSACGSCWAFGAASAMSDRLCIKNKNDQRRISPEDLMECCRGCGYGCNGGFLYQSWSYWKVTGIVTGEGYGDKNSCKPYAFPSCNHHSSGPRDDCSDHHYSTPSCKQECSNQDYTKDYQDDKIKSTKAYSVRGEKNMMNELVNHGPFEVALNVYSDFLVYKNGVYKHQHGRFLGGHAIRIIGYGQQEDGTKYWLCVNSWNEDWGDKGLFKIQRGKNECNIETQGVAGTYQ